MLLQYGSEMLDVSPGQSYTLDEDWTTRVDNDSEAPKDGFKFVNKTREAAAVVCMDVDGRPVAIYVNRNAPFPQGVETLVPKPGAVAVWFDRYAEAGSMVEPEDLATFEVSRDSRSLSVTYRNGRWQ